MQLIRANYRLCSVLKKEIEMKKAEVEYVSRKDCEDAGFVRVPGRPIQKLSTLEVYETKGYLDYGDQKYTSMDRVAVGKKLYRDYYLGGLVTVQAVDPGKIKVDGCGSLVGAEKKDFHESRYHKAMAIIPAEFREVVRLVVIEDKPIKVIGSDRQVNKELFLKRVDLCRGLDRLLDFYLRRY